VDPVEVAQVVQPVLVEQPAKDLVVATDSQVHRHLILQVVGVVEAGELDQMHRHLLVELADRAQIHLLLVQQLH